MKALATLMLACAITLTGFGSVHAQQPAAPPADQPSSAPAAGQVMVDAASLIGSVVRSPDGKDIGKVSALLIDPRDGRITSTMVIVGGLLGMGGSTVAVPWSALKIGQDNRRLVVTMDQKTLEQAPAASPATDKK